ncbi:PREDICTED: ATP-binding cassette sub-family A member 2 [Myotis davidii]|uniref:ATP-binding cassette sub-family A member 2 n=1 Tax=Myotis davidii TaxID=225400 RepID=UPI0007673898|nr:PREDICTED: ATP-binding cassette sub-family A member 2 [Myotis davidii]
MGALAWFQEEEFDCLASPRALQVGKKMSWTHAWVRVDHKLAVWPLLALSVPGVGDRFSLGLAVLALRGGRAWWGGLTPCPSQWVLAFEIFIPLVLFFILLGLRQKKPTISVKEGEAVYRLLFVPSPALDAESVLPRGPEPWGRLQTSSLSRLEVRGCRWEEGLLPAAGTIEPEALRSGNMSSLGFTSKEQRNLGLLVHLMTSNPKILYAPAGSEADRVILKANETFAFVGNVTHYAQVWLNISAEIRSVLEQGRLQQHLHWLQQVGALGGGKTGSEGFAREKKGRKNSPRKGACGWIQFMSKVSVDIFKGFPDEESIVNYTLNQAYQDNVTVFASVIFQTRKDGSLPPHVHYKIRQNSSFTEKTNEIRRAYWRPGPNTGGRGRGWLTAVTPLPSFLVSVLYSKAKLASACGGIIYFLSYVPYMYVAIREEVAHDKITAFEKCIASLMSTTAFGLGSKYFALYEVAGVGIQWHTFSQSPVEGDDFNLLLAVTMLVVDAVVYGVLTWYIEAVHPGTTDPGEGDIRTEMDEIRKNLGMCPQHNVLFDRLTVEEHLWFYSRLKGMAQAEIRKETDKWVWGAWLQAQDSEVPPLLAHAPCQGWWLKVRQFHGLLVKRFHCARRNSKALSSQILLPALFVCVAMTVALSVPEIGDLPPLVLSPSQYHNYTQPRGNFIPYANEERREYRCCLLPRRLQGTDVVIAIFIIVAMSFVPASFVVFLVAEKSTKAKHLQFVSGCSPVTYWLANYVWDMLNYLVPATCCIIILFVFDLPAYTSPTNFPAVLSLFLLYGWSITPIMYPASFWFEVPSSAYVFLIVINLFIGITATVATFLLQLFEHDKDLKAVNSYLKSCFLIFPNYNLGHGLMEMAYNEYLNEYYAKIGQFDKMKSPFEWDIVTRGLVAMAMITVRTKSSQNVKDVVRFFNRNFPEAVLKERHHTKVQYQLKSERISLAQVFSKMEQVVGVLGIEDYSVSQTTLQQVGEDLDTEDEGLISFEEERAQLSFNTDTLC